MVSQRLSGNPWWFGLGWIGLDWVGLVWIGLDWFGLVWIGLDWFEALVLVESKWETHQFEGSGLVVLNIAFGMFRQALGEIPSEKHQYASF